jgi:RND family efflux transporter MFP subunit
VPELEDELAQAVAAGRRAEADYRDANLAYTRLVAVNRSQPDLVAQQDLDTAEARDHATEAALSGARADAAKFRTLIGYTRITAPFDGVITARSADPGALVQAATSSQTQALPLVRLSENQLLRLDFPVSVVSAPDIAVGDPVEIRLEGSSATLTRPITRFTRKIAMETRTMIAEVEVPNPDLRLIPGEYATVVLRVHRHPGALAVPVEAVSGTANPTVFLAGADGVIEERPVKLGLQTDSYWEVLGGVREGDLVMIGSRSGVAAGTRVTVGKILKPNPQ